MDDDNHKSGKYVVIVRAYHIFSFKETNGECYFA